MERKNLMIGVLIGLIVGVFMGVSLEYYIMERQLQALQAKYDDLASQWNDLVNPFIDFRSKYEWTRSSYDLGLISPSDFLNELVQMIDSFIANVTQS